MKKHIYKMKKTDKKNFFNDYLLAHHNEQQAKTQQNEKH